jgi:hypothetical protein
MLSIQAWCFPCEGSCGSWNCGKWNYNSALHMAAGNEWLDVVNLLMDRGANVNIPYKKGYTALVLVSFKGYDTIAEVFLLNRSDVHCLDHRAFFLLIGGGDSLWVSRGYELVWRVWAQVVSLVISQDLGSTNFFTSVHRTNASKIMMIEIDHIFQIITFKSKVAYVSHTLKSDKQCCSFRLAVASLVPKLRTFEMCTLVITMLISSGHGSINISN